MKHLLSLFIHFITVATLAGATAQTANAANLSGKWYGQYICDQGITGLTLSISEGNDLGDPNSLMADFSFYAHPENPWVPSGSYAMAGIHYEESDEFILQGIEWDFQPYGYEMVDLRGAMKHSAGKDILEGEVYFGTPDVRLGCSTFYLERITSDQMMF